MPGADREQITSFSIETTVESRATPPALPPIYSFLDSPTTSPETKSAERADESPPGAYADEDELPPVEHFIDPLPDVGDFAADATTAVQEDELYTAADTPIADASTTDWVETDWQQYDWGSVAALGDTGETEASTAWAATDWDAAMPPGRQPRPTPAQAIASALDQIARRIREGELPAPSGTTDPKAIAATLAALLGIRQ